jgi:ABC-2 type transport system permease protein
VYYIRLYFRFIAQYLKQLMEYRTDFVIGLAGFLLFQITGLGFIAMIFQQISSLGEYSFDMVLFVYGFAQIPRGIDHLLTDNLWMLSGSIIVNGDFDKYLLRPINPLFHLISEVFQPDAFGELIVGIGIVIYASINLHLPWGLFEVLIFIAVVLFGTIIYSSIKLFFASFSFWIKFSQAILYVTYTFSNFAKYPLSIYAPWIRHFITFLIPFAFTAFIPASWFLQDNTLLWALGGTALAAAASAALALFTWKQGIKAYESSGS